MGRMGRRMIPFGAALATVIVLLALLAVTTWLDYNSSNIGEGPADFYGTSREVSLSELVQVADKMDVMPLYLPSALPSGFKLTAIYLKDGPFIAIVVYSAEGNKDYKTAELTIEFTPTSTPPTYEQLRAWAEESEDEMALEINGWPVRVLEKAATGGDKEHWEKYGAYQLLVFAWIEGINYTISPMTLTSDEAIQLVRSMRPIS
ncbi:MAG: hypothetical protein ACFFCW_25070 [Candidatus Hodarchaeota archaeon]